MVNLQCGLRTELFLEMHFPGSILYREAATTLTTSAAVYSSMETAVTDHT